MSEAPPAAERRGILIDLRPLRESPAFLRLFLGNAVAGIGAQLTIVAVQFEIFEITGSTFAVSLVSVIALVPMILAGFWGGMLADAFDRRRILVIFSLIAWASTIGIAALSFLHVGAVWPLYVLSAVTASAATITGATRTAVQSRLVRRELLPAASALSGVSVGLFITIGPALGGVLVGTIGFGPTYLVDVLLFLAGFAGILSLPSLPPEGERHAPGLESVKSGLAFLKHAPNVRLTFIVDIIAMTFGRPHALFPALGAIVLGGGTSTAGALTAAGAIGALLCSIFSGRITGIRMQGRAIGFSIAGYGLSILGLGLVVLVTGIRGTTAHDAPIAWVPVALAALFMALSGATDNVSSIFRQTILQSAAPDNMRGRLQGIFIVVVTGGPRLGDLFVGIVATIGALWLPPVLGGVVIVVLIALVLRMQRGFRDYDARHPTP